MLQTRSQLHNLNTRSNRLLEISLYRTATGQRCFRYRAACLWNSLPEWLKNIISIWNVLKMSYEVTWLNNFLMSRTELHLLLIKF
jgi:hypothetical protein